MDLQKGYLSERTSNVLHVVSKLSALYFAHHYFPETTVDFREFFLQYYYKSPGRNIFGDHKVCVFVPRVSETLKIDMHFAILTNHLAML